MLTHLLPRPSTAMVSAWFYRHLPLTLGIATVGAAVFNVLAHFGEHLPSEVRWLLVAAVVIVLIRIAFLTHTIQLNRVDQRTHRVGRRVLLVSAVVNLLLGFSSLDTIPLLIALVMLLLAPIFFAFRVWIELLDQADRSL